MVKLQQKGNQYFITLRKELVKLKGWQKGCELALEFNEKGNIEIKKIN